MNYLSALIGVTVTILLAVLALFFRAGHLAARIEALERWRITMRTDMHEVSDAITTNGRVLDTLRTLISERTERRPSRIKQDK